MRIEGDGSWRKTVVIKDNKTVPYDKLHFHVNPEVFYVTIDGEIAKEPLEALILKGIYTIISAGRFDNTRVFINDEALRGVQSIDIEISSTDHPKINIESILLPNLVVYE